jgi:type 2 lantibiotic biosynthesis protein LanM
MGVDRSIEIEGLARVMTPPEGPPEDAHWWPVVLAECAAMERLDIPFFAAAAKSATLELDDGSTVADCLEEPSADLVLRRVRELSRADMARQLGFIAGSLHAESVRHDVSLPAAGSVDLVESSGGSTSLVEAAIRIAEEVSQGAVRTTEPTDAATWIAPQYLPRYERYQLQPVGYDLHSGACGPALFLAAVDKVTGRERHRALVLEALSPVRDALTYDPSRFAVAVGTGGATGLGSLVYVLTKVAGLINEPSLLGDAARASALLDAERIAHAPLDVFSGLAGEILGLLALHEAAPDPVLVARADECAQRLLETAQPATAGGSAWATMQGRMLTGFSHGAAGIAYALLRLSAITGNPDHRRAGIEAIRYEDLLLDIAAGNWPDLRDDQQPAYRANWCHGAPGIGLARAGTLDLLDTEPVRRDIDIAVQTTLQLDQHGPDHLCCGNLGHAECLLTIGEQCGRPDLVAEARQRTCRVADRAAATENTFRLQTSLPRKVQMPGFFMGMSGIGYALLRTARPDLLPSVLLWR